MWTGRTQTLPVRAVLQSGGQGAILMTRLGRQGRQVGEEGFLERWGSDEIGRGSLDSR